MGLQLPSSVSSPQDIAELSVEIKTYAKWFSQASIRQKVTGSQFSEAPDMSAGASELLQQIGEINQQKLDQLIEGLEGFKNKAPSMTITLAAPASGDLKQTIVTWCRKNVDPNILVSFKFNATILGGMVVSYGSHIFDWSFRRQILAARGKFPEILRRV